MKRYLKDIRFYFLLLYAVVTILFIAQVVMTKMIPIKYKIPVIIVLLLLFVGMYLLQYGKRLNKVNKILGKILIVILTVLLLFGNLYLFKATSTIGKIGGDDTSTIQYSIVVMEDSEYKTLSDLSGGVFGEIAVGKDEHAQEVEKEIEEELDEKLALLTYEGFDVFAEALYTNEVDAMILNEGFRGMFEDNHPDFDEETRVIATFTYEKEKEDISKSVKDITEDPFLVYISGIDTYGSISTVSRSDVNKIMAVNPTTKQILLIDIPRDYYIPQVCQANQNDKLTHTGIFGVECTVTSVANYFEEDINYYMRVNFSSLVDIVDALGGVNVESIYNFSAGGYDFTVGPNWLNGEAALAFSRERYSLPNGDNDRIENQSRVLRGIIEKATSPSIITNYMGVMDAIGGTFQTNMSDSELSELINMQLDDMSGWNITSYAVTGTGGTDWTPANGFNAYVTYPHQESVEKAKALIAQLKNGEIPQVQ